MKSRKDDETEKEKRDLVEEFIREKARQAALKLIREINHRAQQDVDTRLKYLAPESAGFDIELPPSLRCGRVENKYEEFREGLEELFHRYYELGMTALTSSDPATAAFYFSKCLLLPVSEELKRDQMVRNKLRLALSFKEKLKGSSP